MAGLLCVFGATAAMAQDLHVALQRATSNGPGTPNGAVTITQTPGGALFVLALHGLSPGPHGFHVHENGNCGPTMLNTIRIPAGAAGSHWDPDHTSLHGGPEGPGHLGDLPVLDVQPDGTASQSLTAPRIKDIARLKGHSLVINGGGDNYKEQPLSDGGGGGRLSCGVIGD